MTEKIKVSEEDKVKFNIATEMRVLCKEFNIPPNRFRKLLDLHYRLFDVILMEEAGGDDMDTKQIDIKQ